MSKKLKIQLWSVLTKYNYLSLFYMSSIVKYKSSDLRIFYPQSETAHKEDIIKTIKKGNLWERNIIKVFEKYIKSSSVVLDIGAYIGTHTVCLSKIARHGMVYAFEPQPAVFECLRKTIATNQLHNVKLYNNAVSNNRNIVQFSATDNGRASFSELRPNLRNGVKKIKTKCLTIDSLNLDRCDFIKIDVEFAELFVLDGATETIKRHKPIILIECFNKNLGKLKTILEKLDYNIDVELPLCNYILKPNGVFV